MERRLSMFERAFYVDGRTPVSVMMVARLRGQVRPEQLRHALDRLQAKHPLLACLIPDEPGPPRFVLQRTPPPIPLRVLGREGDAHWLHEAQAERSRPFDAARSPLMRLTLLRGEPVSELLLTAHHCICDGRSVIGTLRDLLRLCGCADADIGGYDALRHPLELLPAHVLGDRRLRRSVRFMSALLSMAVRVRKAGPPRPYGAQYFRHWSLEPEVAGFLAARCRQAGVTLSMAVVAAFQLAFHDVCGPRGLNRIAIAVDPRRFLKKLPEDAFFPMAPTAKFRARRLVSRELWMQARALGAGMRSSIERMPAEFFRSMLGLEYLHGVFDRLVAWSWALPGGRNLIFSNLGRTDLPADCQGFRLEALPGAIIARLSPTTAHLLTCVGYAGRLDFCFMSDERSLPCGRAMEIKDRAMALLLAGPDPEPPDRTRPAGRATAMP